GLGNASHLKAFVAAIIDIHMVRLGADGHLFIRIKNDDIGIRSDCDRSFFREEAEDLCRRGRGYLDETVDADLSFCYSTIVDEAHTVLDSRPAIRDLREVIAPELLLLFEAERTVIG